MPLSVLRTLLDAPIDAAEHILVLINACDSGAFLSRKPFGPANLSLDGKGAHAIMASKMGQKSWHEVSVGPGSVFLKRSLQG
jgi:hypothetical protein